MSVAAPRPQPHRRRMLPRRRPRECAQSFPRSRAVPGCIRPTRSRATSRRRSLIATFHPLQGIGTSRCFEQPPSTTAHDHSRHVLMAARLSRVWTASGSRRTRQPAKRRAELRSRARAPSTSMSIERTAKRQRAPPARPALESGARFGSERPSRAWTFPMREEGLTRSGTSGSRDRDTLAGACGGT